MDALSLKNSQASPKSVCPFSTSGKFGTEKVSAAAVDDDTGLRLHSLLLCASSDREASNCIAALQRDPLRQNRAAFEIRTKTREKSYEDDRLANCSGAPDQYSGVNADPAEDAGATTISQAPCCSKNSAACASTSDDQDVGIKKAIPSLATEFLAEDTPYQELDPRHVSCRCCFCSRRRNVLQQRRYRSKWRYRKRTATNITTTTAGASLLPLYYHDLLYASEKIRVQFSTRLRSIFSSPPANFSFIFLLVRKLIALFCLLPHQPRDINKKPSSFFSGSSTTTFHRDRRKWIRVVLLVYLHVFSMLSGFVAGFATPESIFHSAAWDPGGGGFEEFQQFQPISLRVNPLLRNQRNVPSHNTCIVWTRNSPDDLCALNPWPRIHAIRTISLFHDCPSESGNVVLAALFRLDWPAVKYESDLISYTEYLRDGIDGRDCVLAQPYSRQCLACYRRIDEVLKQVDSAYRSFNKTLKRFDCMLATDSLSATRPFSPNGTCVDCLMWYRKWVLVQSMNIWKEKPCINWCYYAQLACPHMAPSKAVEYAGHPSFQCRDLNIPQATTVEMETCSCFHPCDLAGPKKELSLAKEPTHKSAFDFFPALEHCWAREKRCEKERVRQGKLSEHAAYPTGATHSRAVSRPPLTEDPTTEEPVGYAGRVSGYVDESPPENFNELHFVFHTKKESGEYSDSQRTNELTP